MRTQRLIESYGTLEDTLKMIEIKCKPFLKEWVPILKSASYGDMWLYRGISISQHWGVRKVRTDRKPMSTPIEVQDRLDAAFKKKFGWKARSEGVFCSGDLAVAESYGETYIIFPIGNYKYLWSNSVGDLWIYLAQLGFVSKHSRGREAEKVNAQIMTALDDIPKLYRDSNLKAAIESDHEIMLKCDSYIFIDERYISEVEDWVMEL